MKKGEASLNIFFEQFDTDKPVKEIICFETSKLPVWAQLEDMALAKRNRFEWLKVFFQILDFSIIMQ